MGSICWWSCDGLNHHQRLLLLAERAGQRLFRRRRFHQNQMESEEEEEEAIGLPAVAKGQDELVGALLGPELLRLVAALDQPVVQLPRVRSCTSGTCRGSRPTRPRPAGRLGDPPKNDHQSPSRGRRRRSTPSPIPPPTPRPPPHSPQGACTAPSQPFLDAKTSHYSHVRLIPPKYRSGSSTRPS